MLWHEQNYESNVPQVWKIIKLKKMEKRVYQVSFLTCFKFIGSMPLIVDKTDPSLIVAKLSISTTEFNIILREINYTLYPTTKHSLNNTIQTDLVIIPKGTCSCQQQPTIAIRRIPAKHLWLHTVNLTRWQRI